MFNAEILAISPDRVQSGRIHPAATATARQAALTATTSAAPISADVRTRPRPPGAGRRSPTARSQGSPVTKRQTTHEARAGENMRTVRSA